MPPWYCTIVSATTKTTSVNSTFFYAMKTSKLHIALVLILCVIVMPLFGKKKQVYKPKYTRNQYINWVIRVADSQMKHDHSLSLADGVKKPKWDYTQTLVGRAMIAAYIETGKEEYLNYVSEYADNFILPRLQHRPRQWRHYALCPSGSKAESIVYDGN